MPKLDSQGLNTYTYNDVLFSQCSPCFPRVHLPASRACISQLPACISQLPARTSPSFPRAHLPASRVCISQLPACASPSFSRASIT